MNLTFGKYSGNSYESVYATDPGYINWLLRQSWFQTKKEYPHCKELTGSLKPLIFEGDHATMTIYTDGACTMNGYAGARCGIGIHYSKGEKEDVSRELHVPKPTNNIAELTAILVAMESVGDVTKDVVIVTDSDYAIKCITVWYPKWVEKDTLDNKQNIALIAKCHEYYQQMSIRLYHIRSHTGLQDTHSLGNQRADDLATQSLM